MSESVFKIREKTVLLFGPITSLAQSIGSILLEHGSDIAFIDAEANKSHRFINSLMDMRHVHSQYGRAAAVEYDIKAPQDAKEAISRAAELFGSADILIDVNMFSRPKIDGSSISKLVTNEALEFFTGRGKGRVIYLTIDDGLCHSTELKHIPEENKNIIEFMHTKIQELKNKAITLNTISVGYTDELLLKLQPDKTIQETFDREKSKNELTYMTEPVDIANLISFLASPISVSLNGQLIKANYGLTL